MRTHNPSHLPLYPNVLKIKTIIVGKQKCYLFIKKNGPQSISSYTAAAGMSWLQGGQITDLWTNFFINKYGIFVSQQLLFFFQNIWKQCRFDGLCLRSNRSLTTSWKNKKFKRSFASKELLELVNDWAHDVIVLSKFFV